MSKGKVTVLGINGHIGRVVAGAFVAAGWDVTGMARTEKHRIPGVRFVAGDSDSVEEMRHAIGDADVVMNALNMRYDRWFGGALEAQMARVVAAMGASGKTLLYPGSIYNFVADNDVLTPDTPENPPKPRGEIRVRVEQMYRAAAERGDIQVIVLRAGDFYGPGSTGDWFDQMIMREVKARKISVIGTRGMGHSWAYLPDLGRAFEALAAVRSTLGAFERFHFAGHYVTPEQMGAAITKAAPVPVKVSHFPWLLLHLFGLADPVIRNVAQMGYLWRHRLELRDARLDDLLGPDFGTPFETAVAATVGPFFAPSESKTGAYVVGGLA
jgi:nucleoside-diphosphate-sugar epimerase